MGRHKGDPRLSSPEGSNLPNVKFAATNLPEGTNSRYIKFIMETTPTEPLNKHDVPEMQRRFKNYLEKCAEYDMKVGNQAAYAAIGITKQEVYDWTNRRLDDIARTNFVQYVQQICTRYREGLMQDGKVNPVVGIFWQKNYDGLRDQQETVITNNSVTGESDMKALKQKYLDNAAIVAEVPCTEVAESAEIPAKSSAKVLKIPTEKEPQKAKRGRPRNAQKGTEGK